jgi:Fibronectin type III-like domain
LPITFPQSVGQLPLYYNTKPSGRGYDYVEMSGKPLFPFGFGLSYTKFEYSDLLVDPKQITPDGKVLVSVDIRNSGGRDGSETVQLYLHDVAASVARPLKELKGFQRVTLKAGEKRTVRFELTKDHLYLIDRKMKNIVEPGIFEVLVGGSSDDIRLRSDFEVVKH